MHEANACSPLLQMSLCPGAMLRAKQLGLSTSKAGVFISAVQLVSPFGCHCYTQHSVRFSGATNCQLQSLDTMTLKQTTDTLRNLQLLQPTLLSSPASPALQSHHHNHQQQPHPPSHHRIIQSPFASWKAAIFPDNLNISPSHHHPLILHSNPSSSSPLSKGSHVSSPYLTSKLNYSSSPMHQSKFVHQQPLNMNHCTIAIATHHSQNSWSHLPRSLLELIFTYLSLSDLTSCSLTCRRWYRILSNESSEVWKHHCLRQLSKSTLKSDILSSIPSHKYKSRLRAWHASWDPLQCSKNIFIKPNGFTIHRNPIAQSTDAAKGKIGFITGRHCWEVWWQGPLGTVAVIGVATKESPVQAHGYVPLIGHNCESWGWNLVENILVHNNETQGNFPCQNNAPKYQTGERLRVILDSDDHTLSFEKGYEFLGVAFRDLPMKPLYPAISAVYGNTEVSMVYLGHPYDG